MTTALKLQGIDKHFGPVHANRGVSLAIPKGAIAGIIGENGAGKSTLMSIVYGLYQADAGEILVDGKAAEIASPRDAIRHGIGMVHQHFMLVDNFTVLENVVLGAEAGGLLKPSLKAARAELLRLERDYGLKVDPDALISDLPVGEQQRVEILKALYRGARILILDEPTAVLTPQEADQLFRILAALKDKGTTIILISHKLREILAATDVVFVMRHGQMVAERKTSDTDKEELAELMVGRKVRLNLDKAPARPGDVLMSSRKLGLKSSAGVTLLDNVSLDLHAGEIVCVAGVSGNGQSELLEVLSGIRSPTSGTINVRGHVARPQRPIRPARMRKLGVAHVPEDRHRFGMAGGFNAAETSILGYQRAAEFRRGPLLNHAAATDHCAELMERYDVRPRRPQQIAVQFSGGNQQKLVMARETDAKPRVLLIGQPTRGVDIGAIEFIHRELVRLRDQGCAVLVVSVELDEVMSLADRVVVMYGGRIVATVEGAKADERNLGLMMAGAWNASQQGTSAA